MEELIKLRTPLRSNFTKAANKLEEVLKEKLINIEEIEISFSLLSDKFTNLQSVDNEVITLLSKDSKIEQTVFDEEYERITTYSDRFITLKTKVERLHKELERVNYLDNSCIETQNKKTVKLPKLELEKYDGSIKNWLKFWSIFKKIHEDKCLSDEDKFVYLIQSTAEKSRARDLVESFPPTAENYPLVIECMKSRFGQDEMLIEVYVRELLSLVLNHNKGNLVKLHDKIETYLRALGTLGVTSDKYASMLYPLVESCLPEDILKIWERHISTLLVKDKGEVNKLSLLMTFLKSEVESEQRLAIARNTFGSSKETQKRANKQSFTENKIDVPTAASLLNENLTNEKTCIFCKKGHNSQECFKARKMTIEGKREMAKRAGCCYLCLKRGHVAKQCFSKMKCSLCHKFHCIIMCPNSLSESKIEIPKTVENSDNTQSKDQALTSQSNFSGVLLQTLQVYLRGKNFKHVVRALIDTGSQRSYISSEAVKLLDSESLGEIPIVHNLFGGLETPQQKHRRFKIYLTSLDGNYNCNFEALEQRKICGDMSKTPRGPWMKELRKKGIELTDSYNDSSQSFDSEISLLIGADVAGKLLNGKIEYLSSGPVAVGTHLGWTLMGKIPQVSQKAESYLSIISLLTNDINLPDMWNLDRIGISDPVENQTVAELHKAAYDHFQRNLKINNEGRYEIMLPWLQSHPTIPEGKELAERRLRITVRKLKETNILEAYQDVLYNWLKEGIIEEVKNDEETNPGHFLPHRAVIKNSATTKIRPVFDASAHVKNSPSLNECLAKGPNFLELIPAILTRFRMKEFAVTADIKQAFLQISIDEGDRNYLKFLWMTDGNPDKLKVYRHCRVVFGLTSSPFLLSATLKHHLENAPLTFENTARVLQDSFYVDNCLSSFDNIEESETFVEQSKKLLLSGKFDLRGWRSNYSKLQSCQIPSTKSEKQHEDEESNIVSVLGLLWDVSRDVLFCNSVYYENLDPSKITKRKILAIAQQIYDPLGILCSFTLLPKLLLQECWKQKIPWDKALPEDITKKFLNWQNQLEFLKRIYIPRWMMMSTSLLMHCSLHVFADASKYAYAACIFVRIDTGKSVFCEFVRAKNRITPLKTITIPRLELLACLIAARLAFNVKKDMKIPDIETHFWTDSSNALSWIKRNEQWATFVANRVKEIRTLSNTDDWHHVSGKLNSADTPSRGSSIRHLIETKWLHGPEWLKSPMEEWPKSRIMADEESLNQERKKTVIISTEKKLPWYHNRFSSYLKLVRVIAWMKRFVTNAKKPKVERYFSALTVIEIEKAELMLLRNIQQEVFTSIANPILKPLQPKLDEEGLIRLTTRLIEREDTDNFKRPIVLPGKHPIVQLLILEYHRKSSHAGVQILMSQLRENFWILQCRKTIRQVLKQCRNCRRFEVSKAEVLPAPLPEKRIRNAAAFEITGIDLGGPLYLRNGEKTWFVLFTCAVIRAVHIELVQSLSTEAFLLAFKRFVARRGRPLCVYSDNGTNFVGTSNILRNIDWEKVQETASVKRIQWIFIPPTAAWWGGWWERLIGMTKRILRRVLGRARLNHDELTTVLYEAESMINKRPLTYLSEDAQDLQPITPSLFLQEIRTGSIPELDVFDSSSLNKRLRYRQKLKQDLMQRFRTEYLGQLKNYSTRKHPTDLRIGQVVLVGSDNVNRLEWPLAKVLELYPGRDNNTRVARLKTMNGELLRPYQRLYPLEAQDERKTLISEKSSSIEIDNPSPVLTEDDKDSPKVKDYSDQRHQPLIRTRCGRAVKPVERLDL